MTLFDSLDPRDAQAVCRASRPTAGLPPASWIDDPIPEPPAAVAGLAIFTPADLDVVAARRARLLLSPGGRPRG